MPKHDLSGPDSGQMAPSNDPAPHEEFDELVEIEVEPPLLPQREPLRRIFRVIGMVEQVVGTLLLVLILILVLAQVVQRYVPGTWPWTGELARFSMVWATFMMAGYLVAYAPHHIAIHVVDFLAKGRLLAAIKMFVNVVILLTTIVVAYGGVKLVVQDIGQVTAAGQMPLKYVNSVPIVGMLLVGVRAILGILVADVPALRARGEKELP